jgi:asparagine synthase (glutamine-hydrolysing)
MCGITGLVHHGIDEPVDEPLVRAMTGELEHRGPDADGFHVEPRVGLGARRLRIIDLAAGDQPMANEEGTVWAILNGEIYNFIELREELIAKGHRFRSGCDTEVIAHQYEEDGIDCVRRFRGMFAFAVWDARRGELMVARDRFGIKPLFVAEAPGRMAFASEIKSLLHLPWLDRDWDAAALRAYLRVGYVPCPLTAYRGVRKMPPGTAELWRLGGGGRRGGRRRTVRYWRPWVGERSTTPSFDEARERATELLEESIRLHLRSDVPLGAFLSGGVDSSTVVALTHAVGPRDLKTFSIGFEGDPASELPYAERVARHLGVDHHTEVVGPGEARLLPELLARFDEPFADVSAIPTYLVSRLARREVTVSLSGDGGDELFAGYTVYADLGLYRPIDRVPLPVRRRAAAAAGAVVAEGARGGGFVRRLAEPAPLRYFSLRYGLTPTAGPVVEALSPRLTAFLRGRDGDDARWRDEFATDGSVSDAQRVDQETYLVDDILAKVDRSSMAVSLEARVPLLDHVFAEYVNALPLSYKLRDGQQKVLLRRIGEPYLPEGLFDRPKQGFDPPLRRWLDGPLREFVDERLTGDQLDLFAPAGLRALLELQHSSTRDLSPRVWTLLGLATWAEAAAASRPW